MYERNDCLRLLLLVPALAAVLAELRLATALSIPVMTGMLPERTGALLGAPAREVRLVLARLTVSLLQALPIAAQLLPARTHTHYGQSSLQHTQWATVL